LTKQSTVVRTQAWLPELEADIHALRVDAEGGDARERWRWGAGVSMQVPLFDRKQGRLSGLDAQHAATQERYDGLVASVRSAARVARTRLVSTQARAHQYESVVLPAQRAVMQQTLLQYNAMQFGVFPLLAARRELLSAELSYTESLRDYWIARAELDALTQGRVVRRNELSAVAPETESTNAAGGH
jgi:outer membrane protein TolC